MYEVLSFLFRLLIVLHESYCIYGKEQLLFYLVVKMLIGSKYLEENAKKLLHDVIP